MSDSLLIGFLACMVVFCGCMAARDWRAGNEGFALFQVALCVVNVFNLALVLAA